VRPWFMAARHCRIANSRFRVLSCGVSVPLCYIYPPMLHYKACARTRKQKVADIVMIVFGLLAALYTTIQTVRVRLFFVCYCCCEERC